MSAYEKDVMDSQPDAVNASTITPLTNAAEDLRLIRRIAVQDDDAFEVLYRRYTRRLAAFLTPWLHDAALVDEVTNATMFVVWQKAAHFRPSTRPSTWLFGIARRKALKALKTSTPQSPDLPDTSSATPAPAEPEALYLRQEQALMITQAIRMLPAHLREVVEGVYYHTLTYTELATRLDCSVSTVKSRMDSARRRLAVQLRHMLRTPSGQGGGDRGSSAA